ncbi:hypothetical protein ABIE33_006830 [Ensifer sp. 4252]
MAEDRWEREERHGPDGGKPKGKQLAPWNEAVVIRPPNAEHDVVVGSASQAASVLKDNWPAPKSGSVYQAAVTACLEAMSGHVPGYIARWAFVKAARDAGFLR